jgi:hypothetical protein
MDALMTRMSPQRPRLDAARVAIVAATVVVVAVAFRMLLPSLEGPPFVDALRIENTTEFGVEVDVRGDADDGGVLLGYALPTTTTTKQSVVDVGDVWIFTFERGGVSAGDLTISRHDLARRGWRVAVPASVEERLIESGQVPFPNEGK